VSKWVDSIMRKPDNPAEDTASLKEAFLHEARGLLPSGYVVVDRARFERWSGVLTAVSEWREASGRNYPVTIDSGMAVMQCEINMVKAFDALQPGDLEPLP